MAIRSKLADSYKPATANKMLSAMRGALRAAWQLQQMSAEDYQRAAEVKSVTGETLPAGRALTTGEIMALMRACSGDDTYAGARDCALFALLRAGGLRRAEVCALDLADYNPADTSLVVRGKRNKERSVPLSGGAVDALNDWIAVRGNESGPLLLPIAKGGKRIIWRRMTPQAVYLALARRALESGVKELSPHDFRRTFVSDLLDSGADIVTVQKLAGHANVQTTSRYDRRGQEVKRKAVRALHVPYRRKQSGT